MRLQHGDAAKLQGLHLLELAATSRELQDNATHALWDVQEKPPFFRLLLYMPCMCCFFFKYFLKHVTNESEVKEPSLSSILLYIDDRKPTKSRNLSRFKFQVKLLALLTRLFGMEQHKTSSPTGSTDPPACFQKVWQKISARDITTTCKGVKPATMPTSSIGSKGWPSTWHLASNKLFTSSTSPAKEAQRSGPMVLDCFFLRECKYKDLSTLKLWWSYCRASFCKDLRVRFWCFFTQIYCFFRSISFFSPSSPCLGPFSHFLISMIYDCVSDVHINVEVANHPRFFCCF